MSNFESARTLHLQAQNKSSMAVPSGKSSTVGNPDEKLFRISYRHDNFFCDPSESSRHTWFSPSFQFRGLQPDQAIEVQGSASVLPNVTIWVSDYHTAAEAIPSENQAHQIIWFPGQGETLVRTRQEELACANHFGVNIETENLVSVVHQPGRQGPGIILERLTLIRRLSTLIDAPLRRPLSFNTRFDVTVGHRAAIGELIRTVLSPTLGSALTASPAIASDLSATFLDLVLHALPHTYSEDLCRPPSRIAPKHIKRAIDYVESHVHSALTVDDVALASGVSIRSLQYGFRHFLDMSPADHIRNTRLERARREILDCPGAVSEIAGRWGFANLARFNARFRNAYGETPSEYRRRHLRSKLSHS